ncbi:MAG: hypothetical protein KJZ91_01365, partial [Myxococcales bacterium]|nr:hypothetical protein [Myxococcales bacterium]
MAKLLQCRRFPASALRSLPHPLDRMSEPKSPDGKRPPPPRPPRQRQADPDRTLVDRAPARARARDVDRDERTIVDRSPSRQTLPPAPRSRRTTPAGVPTNVIPFTPRPPTAPPGAARSVRSSAPAAPLRLEAAAPPPLPLPPLPVAAPLGSRRRGSAVMAVAAIAEPRFEPAAELGPATALRHGLADARPAQGEREQGHAPPHPQATALRHGLADLRHGLADARPAQGEREQGHAPPHPQATALRHGLADLRHGLADARPAQGEREQG